MSQKYLAWNGEEYPWPPPDGWYEASDDRWWAPNSGPGPKTATPESPDAAASPLRNEAPTQTSDAEATTASPTISQTPETIAPGSTTPPSQLGAGSAAQQTPFGSSPAQDQQQPQYGSAQGNQPAPHDNSLTRGFQPAQYGAAGTGGGPPAKKGSKLPLILAALLGVLVIGAIAVFVVSRDSDENVATTAPATTASVERQQATTPTVAEATTSPVDRAAALATFREFVEDSKIVGLDDDSLDGTGEEACNVAAQTPDSAAWADRLAAIVTNIRAQQASKPPSEGAPLTESTIEKIYAGALTSYCPAEAERLDVST